MVIVLLILTMIGGIISIRSAVDTAKAEAWDATTRMIINAFIFVVIIFYLYGRLYDISPNYFCSSDMGFLRKYW